MDENNVNQNNTTEEIQKLLKSKQELNEAIKEENDPLLKMQYEEELKSINEELQSIQKDGIDEKQSIQLDENDTPSSPSQDSNNNDLNYDIIDYDPNDYDISNYYETVDIDTHSKDQNTVDVDTHSYEEYSTNQPEASQSQNITNYEFETLEKPNESISEKAKRLAKEYARAQAEDIKVNTKKAVQDAKRGVKNKIEDAKDATKHAILNLPPVRFARGVGRFGKKVFKGFKTAGRITVGLGALSVEAVQNAKKTIDKAKSTGLKDVTDFTRDHANMVLDRLDDKILAKQVEVALKQYTLEQEQNQGR